MRAQYALEAMLIAAVFFVLISLFAGLYLGLSNAERSAIERNGLRRAVDLVGYRADAAYFLGEGNVFYMELPENSTLSYSDGMLVLSRGGSNASKKVFPGLVLVGAQGKLRIRNLNGTVYIEGS